MTGDAEISSTLLPGPIAAPFVVTYKDSGVSLVSEIAQMDGSVVSVTSSSSPDTTEAEIVDDGAFGVYGDLFLNFAQSQINSSLNAFFDYVHEAALADLEPIELPGSGI